MIIAIKIAMLKLFISNELPIILSVNVRVNALMTNKNNPKESTVIGSVKITRRGRTNMFNIDKIKLAVSAAKKPSM